MTTKKQNNGVFKTTALLKQYDETSKQFSLVGKQFFELIDDNGKGRLRMYQNLETQQ